MAYIFGLPTKETRNCFFCKNDCDDAVVFSFRDAKSLPPALEPWREYAFVLCGKCRTPWDDAAINRIIDTIEQFAIQEIIDSN